MKISGRKALVVALILGCGTALTYADDDALTAAQRAASGQEPPANVSAAWWAGVESRDDLEDMLVAKWASELPETGHMSDIGDFALALSRLDDARLHRAAEAATLQALTATVIGAAPGTIDDQGFFLLPASDPNASVPMALDPNTATPTDGFVFVPTTSCRVFDTRFDTRGIMGAGETRSFYTNAISSGEISWLAQGGTASGCPEIPFDPVAVAITITVAGPLAKGNVRMWDYLGLEPPTSHLNYGPIGTNLANTTIVKTCSGCGPDVNVKTTASTHLLGDVVGYFVAEDKIIDLNVFGAGLTLGATTTSHPSGVQLPDGGQPNANYIFTVPGNYTPGTPFSVRVLYRGGTSCNFYMSENSPTTFWSTNGASVSATLRFSGGASALAVPAPASGSTSSYTMTLTPSADVFPGYSFALSIWRNSTNASDTCDAATMNIVGLSVSYD